MHVPTEKVVEQSKLVPPMTTRRRTVSSTNKLPAPALNEPRMLEQKVAEAGRAVPSTKATRMRAPTEIVEQDVSILKVVKRGHGRPNVEKKQLPAYEPREVLCHKQALLEDDQDLDKIEKVDQLLAEQQQMQCSDWEHAQDADPVNQGMKKISMATLHPAKYS